MSKVADWIGVGAPLLDVEITEVSSIEAAGAQSVVFAMDKETLTKALESKAGRSWRTRIWKTLNCRSIRGCCGWATRGMRLRWLGDA